MTDSSTSEKRSETGRKGGEAGSQDREHMTEIGRKGGEAVSQDRQHMSETGRMGGEERGGSFTSSSPPEGENNSTNEKKNEAGRKGREY